MERLDFDNQLDKILSESENLIPSENLPTLPFMPEVPDVHDWYRFEYDLWEKGEKIRQLVFDSKKKLNNEQIKRICNICTNPSAKRGRQSFVMLLGKRCYAQYAPIIAPFLSDDDICGHIVETFYKMGTPNYIAQITPLINHKRTWIRNSAKKYVNRYS